VSRGDLLSKKRTSRSNKIRPNGSDLREDLRIENEMREMRGGRFYRSTFPGEPARNLSRVTGVLLVNGKVSKVQCVIYREVEILVISRGREDESLLEEKPREVSEDSGIASEMELLVIPEQGIGDIAGGEGGRVGEKAKRGRYR
jgi:hypothetical protein